jgi:predicted alpha/beta hydrolase family esterase
MISTGAKLVTLGLGVLAIITLYHEVVFPSIPDHARKPTVIYTSEAVATLPGYVGASTASNRQVVVFVHGIRDNGRDCWTNDNLQYWPALVADQAKGWNVFVADYSDRISIEAIAAKMRVDLTDVFKRHSHVVFVAHSMGGLVVREFLIQNQEYIPQVSGIYLLATPSLGSKVADLVSSLGIGNVQVDQLRTEKLNSFLRDLNERWKPFRESIKTQCAYEQRKTWLFNVVDSDSANAVCDELGVPVNTGHSGVAKPASPDSTQNRHLMLMLSKTFVPVEPGEKVELSYRFAGPIRAKRADSPTFTLAFSLTDAVQNRQLSGQKIEIESASITAQVANESEQRFAFDYELLIPSEHLPPDPALSGTDFAQLTQLQGTYAPLRRLLSGALYTDTGRGIHSLSPLIWSVDFSNSHASAGELKVVRNTPIDVGDQGLPVQLFVWTLFGGQNTIEFNQIDVNLKVRLVLCQ